MNALDKMFPNEETCLSYLIENRLSKIWRCPRCFGEDLPSYGAERRLKCGICQSRFSPVVGTIFFRSRLPLKLWFQCIFLTCISRAGVSSSFVSRFLGLNKDTAWRMMQLIRLQMSQLVIKDTFGGPGERVELDETLIKARDRETNRSQRVNVFGISNETSVWTVRVNNRRRCELYPIIKRHVRRGTIIHTDGFKTYSNLSELGYVHRAVNHRAGFWVGPDGANTIHIDSYWAYLKRTLTRTYVSVLTHNLDLYLKEVEIRFNYRDDPTALFWDILSFHLLSPNRAGPSNA